MTPEQRLERIAAWAADEASVSGVIVVGSRARRSTPADAYSDSDVVLVCSDPEQFIANDAWVAAFGQPVLTFVEPTALRDRQERRVLYDDGGDVDFVPVTGEDAESVLASPSAGDLIGRGGGSWWTRAASSRGTWTAAGPRAPGQPGHRSGHRRPRKSPT